MITSGLFSSFKDDWATPQELYNNLDAEFNFKLDPCASEHNHKAPLYYTKEEDGLTKDWGKLTVFINPPYGRAIGQWVKKAYEHGLGGGIAVALLPSRSDTNWWGYVMKATEIRLVKGRLHFNDGEAPAPFPSCIVIWGTPKVPVIKRIDVNGKLIP